MRCSTAILAAVAAIVLARPVDADTVKVGFVAVLTGPEAHSGSMMEKGADLFIKSHPTVPGGHKVELLKRDTAGPAADRAKRLMLELVTRDQVSIITGVNFSNEGFAMMDVCKEARVPTVIMLAGANGMTDGCPYAARISFSMWQAGYPMGEYAAKQLGMKTAAIVYANYAPGKDSSAAFRSAFEKAGGTIVADLPLPFPTLVDFTPFMQRVRDAKPNAVYVFVPAGKWATGIMKVYAELGMRDEGIKLIGPGDITQDTELPNMGDVPIGVVTVHHYSAAGQRPENLAFVKLWKESYGPDSSPDFFGEQGWSGMKLIYDVIERTNAKVTPESFLKVTESWKYDAPRGPMSIDPITRDVIDNQYVREVRKVDGKLQNTEIYTIPMVSDPWRQFGKKPQ